MKTKSVDGIRKPRRFVRMFKPQFATLVAEGKKRQTVRPWPARVPRVGDIFDGRMWEGAPYRSRQVPLRTGWIVRVERVQLLRRSDGRFSICAGEWLTEMQCESFARADGFADGEEMARWFEKAHGLPFEGILIEWDARDEVQRVMDKVNRGGANS